MTPEPPEEEKIRGTRVIRLTTDTATAIVAASVLTISIGSISVALNVVSDDLGGIAGAGQVLSASGVEPGPRQETGLV